MSVLTRSGRGATSSTPSLSSDEPGLLAKLPSGRTVALLIGVVRALIGLGWLARPVDSVRAMGMDTATANRAAWLGQMAAGRDAAIGLGTLGAATRGSGRPWLLAGAASDAIDAAAMMTALRQGRLKGAASWAVAGSAAGAALLGLVASAGVRRR
jgi:hypothetical protein